MLLKYVGGRNHHKDYHGREPFIFNEENDWIVDIPEDKANAIFDNAPKGTYRFVDTESLKREKEKLIEEIKALRIEKKELLAA